MRISARIDSGSHRHLTSVQTNDSEKTLSIPPKTSGFGSSVNGAELLMLALATCFCNDIYREAAKRQIPVSDVKVHVTGEFGAEGEPGTNFTYTAKITSDASPALIRELLQHTDKVAEIHNTLRKGLDVRLIIE